MYFWPKRAIMSHSEVYWRSTTHVFPVPVPLRVSPPSLAVCRPLMAEKQDTVWPPSCAEIITIFDKNQWNLDNTFSAIKKSFLCQISHNRVRLSCTWPGLSAPDCSAVACKCIVSSLSCPITVKNREIWVFLAVFNHYESVRSVSGMFYGCLRDVLRIC